MHENSIHFNFRHKFIIVFDFNYVHPGNVFSTSGVYREYIGGTHEYIGECSMHRRHVTIHVGGYDEYIWGCSVHRMYTMRTSEDNMVYVGEQIDKSC